MVGFFVRYMKDYHEIHWKAAKRILHYVQGTKHFEIHYAATSPLELVGFTDSDCDRDSTDTNLNSGYESFLHMVPSTGQVRNNTMFPFHQLRPSTKEH